MKNGLVAGWLPVVCFSALAVGCGSGTIICSANQVCTPTSGANPCQNYQTTCSSSTATPACTTSGKADGVSCGGSNVCTAGVCGPPTRTVSGKLRSRYRKEDGTTTVVAGSPAENPVTVTGLLVADNSANGYTLFPVALDADFHFSVSNVPIGHYFLQVDTTTFPVSGTGQVATVNRTLYELTTSTPDLTTLVNGRSDRVAATQRTPVTLNLTDGVSWRRSDTLIIAGSQVPAYQRPALGLSPPISNGATSISGTFDWQDPVINFSPVRQTAFLPDASKGDVTWVYHRTAMPVSSTTGASTTDWRYALEYAKLANLSIPNGGPATITATLSAAPQTGSLPGDFRSSQFAALATAVNPAATQSANNATGVSVLANPYSLTYPDMGVSPVSLGFFITTDATTDVNYGALHYGRFFDSVWHEFAEIFYSYDINLNAPGYPGTVTASASYLADIPMSSVPTSYTPTLSPPTAPKINGIDAFTTHSAGAAPIIGWSAPAIGTATRYTVGVTFQIGTNVMAGDVVSLRAVVYSGNSFKVPGTFMKPGQFYSGEVLAVSSPETLDGPPFAQGLPHTSVGTDFGLFGP